MSINDTAIDDVIITGDFNDNQLDHYLSIKDQLMMMSAQ
jgi:hypothetical protein